MLKKELEALVEKQREEIEQLKTRNSELILENDNLKIEQTSFGHDGSVDIHLDNDKITLSRWITMKKDLSELSRKSIMKRFSLSKEDKTFDQWTKLFKDLGFI